MTTKMLISKLYMLEDENYTHPMLMMMIFEKASLLPFIEPS